MWKFRKRCHFKKIRKTGSFKFIPCLKICGQKRFLIENNFSLNLNISLKTIYPLKFLVIFTRSVRYKNRLTNLRSKLIEIVKRRNTLRSTSGYYVRYKTYFFSICLKKCDNIIINGKIRFAYRFI